MYSAAGDDEVDAILAASHTWDELLANMDAAVHKEIHDTAVRDRLYESFEGKLQRRAEAEGTAFETYEDYCERRWPQLPADAAAAATASTGSPTTNPAQTTGGNNDDESSK